jgi:hypothetical protein
VDKIFTIVIWVVAGLFGTLGGLLLLVGALALLQMVAIVWRGRRTIAMAVGDAAENPKFSFTDDTGQTRVVSKAVSSIRRQYHDGEDVPLVYLPDKPDTFVVDRFGDKWGIPLVLVAVGGLLLWPCLLFALGSLRQLLTLTFVAVLFTAIGLICLSLGLTLTIRELRFRRRALPASARIREAKCSATAAIERNEGEDREVLTRLPRQRDDEPWTLLVEFDDFWGNKRQGRIQLASSPGQPGFETGGQVSILYDPDAPWDIRQGGASHWFGPLVLILIGLGFVAAGVVTASGVIR